MSVLADRLVAVDAALHAAGMPHAFGGAIALAYCTEEPRGTRDIDVNVFVGSDRAAAVLRSLPPGVTVHDADIDAVRRDGQVRVWWDDTPIDVFFDVHRFHEEAAADVRSVPFAGGQIPVLGCTALAVFKAVFNRTKDWADIEAMLDACAVDRAALIGWVVRLFGTSNPQAERLARLIDS
jgi:hypothetical protein